MHVHHLTSCLSRSDWGCRALFACFGIVLELPLLAGEGVVDEVVEGVVEGAVGGVRSFDCVQSALHAWEQRRDSQRVQSSFRTCPLSFLLFTLLLHRLFELVVLLVFGVWWTWESLCEESVTACFGTIARGLNATPAPTSTSSRHDRRDLQQDPRLSTCQLESQNDMSSTLDNYLQSQQQSSSTAHNHRSVQTRPADQVRPMQ